MILNSDMFFLVRMFSDSAIAIQLLLSLNNSQNTYGFGRYKSKIKDTSFINDLKVITLSIACLNAIYYSSIILQSIYVCNLLHDNTVHTMYVITYPVRDMTFSALSESD